MCIYVKCPHTHARTQHACKKEKKKSQTHLLSPENSNFILTSSWGRSKSGQVRSSKWDRKGSSDILIIVTYTAKFITLTKLNDRWLSQKKKRPQDLLAHARHLTVRWEDISLHSAPPPLLLHWKLKSKLSDWGGKTVFPRRIISGYTAHELSTDYSLWLQLWWRRGWVGSRLLFHTSRIYF